MRMRMLLLCLTSSLLSCSPETLEMQSNPGPVDRTAILGRWDATVYDIQGVYPSWFEIEEKDDELGGSFVGRYGNARPIRYLHFDGDQLYLSLPRQYERPVEDLLFVGKVEDGRIDGQTKSESGKVIRFQAERAPALEFSGAPEWGEPIELIRQDLSNWMPRNPNHENKWRVEDDLLINGDRGTDLITREKFTDFKLHLEFKYPEGSNSGVYLRGRYEVQIEDNYGKEPTNRRAGGVYGFLTPARMAIKPAGEWNTYDITLLGRKISVRLNDELIIDNGEIPGVTGGALESREGDPGPIMLQGDHGRISFRNIVLTPAK